MFTGSTRLQTKDMHASLAVVLLGAASGVLVLVIADLPMKWLAMCLLGTVVLVTAILLGNLRRVLLATAIFDIPLGIDIHLFRRTDTLGALGGLVISLTTVCLAGLYVLWITDLMMHRTNPPKFLPAVTVPACTYMGVLTLSTLVAADKVLSLFLVLLFLQMFLLYFYIANHVTTPQDLRHIIHLLLIGLGFEAAVLIFQFVTKTLFTTVGLIGLEGLERGAELGSGLFRPPGTVGWPTDAAAYLAPLLLLSLVLVLHESAPRAKVRMTLLFTMGAGALVVTFTRASWIAFVVGFLVIVIVGIRRGRLRPGALIGVLVAGGLIVAVFYPLIVQRLTKGADTMSDRLVLNQLAWRVIQSRPLLGVGANNLEGAMRGSLSSGFLQSRWFYLVHNEYLRVAGETGLPGLVSFLWFLAAICIQCLRASSHGDPVIGPVALGIFVGIVCLAVNMLVENALNRAMMQLLWSMAGVAAAAGYMSRQGVYGKVICTWPD